MTGDRVREPVPDSVRTAPERFSEQGYRTIAISENGHAGRAKRLDERFDDFTFSALSNVSDIFSTTLAPTLLKYAFNIRSHGPGLSLDKHAHARQNAFYTTDIAKRKIKAAIGSDERFFGYIHYNDPHHPYIPPLQYRDEFISEIDASTEEALAFARDMHENATKMMGEQLPISDEQWEMLYAMYDATIKYTDSCIGELFDFVTDRSENTIVVVTADHGELFGEYGLLTHSYVVHDSITHVPLVTYGLKGIGERTTETVQHLDVMKTLLSLVGADTSQFQGYDLRTENRTRAISQVGNNEANATEAVKRYASETNESRDVDTSNLPNSMATAVRTTKFKLVHTEQETKLYELPNETEDVSDVYPGKYDELHSFVEEWLQSKGEPVDLEHEDADLSAETEQHLREMGYMK